MPLPAAELSAGSPVVVGGLRRREGSPSCGTAFVGQPASALDLAFGDRVLHHCPGPAAYFAKLVASLSLALLTCEMGMIVMDTQLPPGGLSACSRDLPEARMGGLSLGRAGEVQPAHCPFLGYCRRSPGWL